MKLCVIPARGGSKRIPHKNIKEFCGKPMISWAIDAAKSCGCFDQIVVSTDDANIAAIALSCGATVPFMRPATLSDDHTGTTAVVAHATRWLDDRGQSPTAVCCLYATAPFVRPQDLLQGLTTLTTTASDYTFSITSYPFPIQRALRVDKNKRVAMFDPRQFNSRSQDLEEAYHDAGQFYWGTADAWRNEKIIFNPQSTFVLLPRHRVQDIDTIEDWERATWLFKALQAEGDNS